MPVMAVMRAERRSTRSRSPATPAFLRTMLTTSATVVATTTPMPASSRPGSAPYRNPATTPMAARIPNVARISQP